MTCVWVDEGGSVWCQRMNSESRVCGMGGAGGGGAAHPNGFSPGTYLLGARINPLLGVGVVDAAADLQATGPGAQRLPGSVLVARAQHDDVGAG